MIGTPHTEMEGQISNEATVKGSSPCRWGPAICGGGPTPFTSTRAWLVPAGDLHMDHKCTVIHHHRSSMSPPPSTQEAPAHSILGPHTYCT